MSCRVAVVGLGVAGSVLSYLLKSAGIEFNAYEMSTTYRKPCGESIPAWVVDEVLTRYNIPRPEIVAEVSKFKFISKRGATRVISGKDVIWYIVRKSEWINSLRTRIEFKVSTIRKVEKLCRENGLVVDARGPFSSKGLKVSVWRGYAPNSIGLDDEAVIIVDWSEGVGLAWAFPYGDLVNVGGGFKGLGNPRSKSLQLLSKLGLKEDDIVGEAFSLVTIYPEVRVASGNCVVHIGESAGLVMALGGEGIRPAILSAVALYEAIESQRETCEFRNIVARYARTIRGLIRSVKLQKTLLTIAATAGERLALLLLSRAPQWLIEKWLKGKL